MSKYLNISDTEYSKCCAHFGSHIFITREWGN